MIHSTRRQWRYLAARAQRGGQWSVLLLHPNDDPFGPVAYEFTVGDRSQVAAAVEKVMQEGRTRHDPVAGVLGRTSDALNRAVRGRLSGMRIVIEGFELPGARFCDRDGVSFDGVHVGVQVGREPCDLVSGDADAARWELDVDVIVGNDGRLDFKGPAVHGKRGDRFLYLTWGRVDDGDFEMFRRAKLMLNTIDSHMIATATSSRRSLVGAVRLTDERGGPRCARVEAPDLVWTVA